MVDRDEAHRKDGDQVQFESTTSVLPRVWKIALGHTFHICGHEVLSMRVGVTATDMAMSWLAEVIGVDTLRLMTSVLFRGGEAVEALPPGDDVFPIEIHDGIIRFYQNRVRWRVPGRTLAVTWFGMVVYKYLLSDRERKCLAGPETNGMAEFCAFFSDFLEVGAHGNVPATGDRSRILTEILQVDALKERTGRVENVVARFLLRQTASSRLGDRNALTECGLEGTMFGVLQTMETGEDDGAGRLAGLLIERSARLHLGSNADLNVRDFVNEFLLLAPRFDELSCRALNDDALVFVGNGSRICIAEIPNARGKLRMICARLAAICNEQKAGRTSAYGGESELEVRIGVNDIHAFSLRFVNTQAQQEFDLVRESRDRVRRSFAP